MALRLHVAWDPLTSTMTSDSPERARNTIGWVDLNEVHVSVLRSSCATPAP